MQRTLLITFAAALILAPGVVHAQENRDTVRIEIGDIDTSSQQGAERMLRRLRHAAEDVCDVRRGPRPLTEQQEASQCLRETMRLTVAQLGDPMVTAAYAAREPAQLASAR